VFPREWEQLIAPVPDLRDGGNIPAACVRLLASSDLRVREDAARRWCAWEDTHVSLVPGWVPDERYDDPTFRMVFARLVTHYWAHDCLLTPAHGVAPAPTVARKQLIVPDDAGHGGGSFVSELIAGLTMVARRSAAWR
jgi:proline iminopeptidase